MRVCCGATASTRRAADAGSVVHPLNPMLLLWLCPKYLTRRDFILAYSSRGCSPWRKRGSGRRESMVARVDSGSPSWAHILIDREAEWTRNGLSNKISSPAPQ